MDNNPLEDMMNSYLEELVLTMPPDTFTGPGQEWEAMEAAKAEFNTKMQENPFGILSDLFQHYKG